MLARNNLGDNFAEQLSIALKADEYVKSVDLKKNKIGLYGVKCLAEAVYQHNSILTMDLRHNPGIRDAQAPKLRNLMRNCFFNNLRTEILQYPKF